MVPRGNMLSMVMRLQTGAKKTVVPLAEENPHPDLDRIYICAFTSLPEATLTKLRWADNG